MSLSEDRKRVLNDKRDYLVGTIQLHGVWALLHSRRIITRNDEETIRLNRTHDDQVGALLDHLSRRTDQDFETFCKSLELSNQEHVVRECLTRASQASIKRDVRHELEERYSRLRDIYTAPWAQEFALDSAVFYITLRIQKAGNPTSQKAKHFHQDDLFISHRNQDEARGLKSKDPKRILIEGEPGMGKTTLCQNLAFRWSQEKCQGQCKGTVCIHSFHIVIYIAAAYLKGYVDLATAVQSHLLPKMSIDEVNSALNMRAGKTLLVIDSYDEGFTDNPLLHDLIQGKAYSNATLLVTSRPNYLRDMLKDFDSKLYTDGFNGEQKRLYVEKFAKCSAQKCSKFRDLISDLLDDESEVASLCCSPLNLAILCQVMSSEERQDLGTRTELYETVNNFRMKKASKRINCPTEYIEANIIRPLCKLSFEAYTRNSVSLSSAELQRMGVKADEVCHSGYLTRKIKVSLIHPEEHFSFSHKTFLEYLSAKHLAETYSQNLQGWLKTVDSCDWRQHESFILFMLDSLHGKSLVEVLLVILEHFAYSPEKSEIYNFPVSCFLMSFLIHLKTVDLSPQMEDYLKFLCHLFINFTAQLCSSCGNPEVILTFASIRGVKRRNTSLEIEDTETGNFDVLKYLSRLSGWDTLFRLKIECVQNNSGHPNAFPCHAENYTDYSTPLVPLTDGNDCFRIAIEELYGNDIRGMEIKKGYFEPCKKLLKATLGKPLRTLKIHSCKVDDTCVEILRSIQALKHVSLSDLTFARDDHRERLLSSLVHLSELDELYLEINLENTNYQETELFGQILKMDQMKRLTIDGYGLSEELHSVLWSNIPTMTSLKELKLSNYDFKHLHMCDSDDSQLQLQTLALHYVWVEAVSFQTFCELIENERNLRKLELLCINLQVPNKSLYLFKSIAKCHNMTELLFNCPETNDDAIVHLCKMLDSLEQLECLVLRLNDFSVDGKEHIREYAKRKQKEFILYI
ncbi:hypothetical protein CAPTEDRAFT_186465 [Capitella teleta]|uniref:NACHT domain-containing protein n=1 Tax=Capitella teleta TaxID=283909 RepID=R7TFW4_CAPTE|nr:hypothetical protein CAPTEDRAFT_186465 [Capitella teleta]|eukprot:ELT89936.1 hypothetical protein CAPTEDRAFT_186465 [Capitella teleta]